MANYESLRSSVENNGEVMVRLSSGEELELHKHNVRFDDGTKEIIVDAGTETYWINAENIAYYWIHKEGPKKE
jgi:hypothetical protein